MKEIHGIVARKVGNIMADNEQAVRVTDGDDCILLVLSTNANHPAGMMPDEARFIARKLVEAAKRFEARGKISFTSGLQTRAKDK